MITHFVGAVFPVLALAGLLLWAATVLGGGDGS